ncbi:MAG: serine protease [Luteolibacter sp.]
MGVLEDGAGGPVTQQDSATAGEVAAFSTAAGLSEKSNDSVRKTSRPEAKDPIKVSDKVVIIEGDVSRGTGFLCSTEGALWLYTAAHVISGNKSIKVRDQKDNRYQSFELMQVADGVDLVRLKITGSDVQGLKLESPEVSAEIGEEISAVGNSDGTGVIAVESGEIRGKGPDSWEISNEIIPGNSGGPVVAKKNQKVIGIVTHLLLGKKETWAADTRFANVRRFAARLDRPYTWTTVTPARFLKEFQIIDELDQNTKMGYAVLTVFYEAFERPSRIPRTQPLSEEEMAVENWKKEARVLVNNHPNHKVVSTYNRILQRNSNYNQVENRRELHRSISSSLGLKGNIIKPDAFSWYHRESYRQSIEWRQRLLALANE